MPFTASPPSIFPTYLLPSLPFRRRSSTSTTTTTSSPSSSPASSPLTNAPPPSYLTGSQSHLRCSRCLTDLCLTSQIISKGFTGRHGRAYLVSPPASHNTFPDSSASSSRDAGGLPNTHTHKPVPRQLVTGAHTVSDVSCALCGSVLGWKYVAAEEEAQRYKVGKFILETKRVSRGVCWENDEAEDEQSLWEVGGVRSRQNKLVGEEERIEFDSQDEDECEDLFAGIWSPQLASRRRKSRQERTW